MSDNVLIGIPQNPIPVGATAGMIRTRDGKRLRFARWRASGRATKGSVLLITGRSEFIEKYFETVEDLRARGFSVAIFDWRGQGASERALANPRKGHIGSITEFETDLIEIIEQVLLPDCPPPHFAIAHSMGGLATLHAAPRISRWLERIVLSAPFLGLSESYGPTDLIRLLATAGARIGLGGAYAIGGSDTPGEWGPFSANTVTSDLTRFTRAAAILEARPDLALGGPTFGWLAAMLSAQDTVQLPEFCARIALPVLIVAAGNDTIVSNTAIERVGRLLRTGGKIVIDGSKHELMMERDVYREQFLAAVDAFIPGSPTFS